MLSLHRRVQINHFSPLGSPKHQRNSQLEVLIERKVDLPFYDRCFVVRDSLAAEYQAYFVHGDRLRAQSHKQRLNHLLHPVYFSFHYRMINQGKLCDRSDSRMGPLQIDQYHKRLGLHHCKVPWLAHYRFSPFV